jgi:hypothetical protein
MAVLETQATSRFRAAAAGDSRGWANLLRRPIVSLVTAFVRELAPESLHRLLVGCPDQRMTAFTTAALAGGQLDGDRAGADGGARQLRAFAAPTAVLLDSGAVRVPALESAPLGDTNNSAPCTGKDAHNRLNTTTVFLIMLILVPL